MSTKVSYRGVSYRGHPTRGEIEAAMVEASADGVYHHLGSWAKGWGPPDDLSLPYVSICGLIRWVHLDPKNAEEKCQACLYGPTRSQDER